MSAYARFLICGPAVDAERARAAAAAWEGANAATLYAMPSLYLLAGGDPAVATHTCSFGLINLDYVHPIAAAIAVGFPGWQMIREDNPEVALALAGLAKVQICPPC